MNKIIQRYQALSADDFEQLFLIHTVPVDQRTAAYYNAMLLQISSLFLCS